MTPFEQMVADRMAEMGWSSRAVAARAESKGRVLSHATVARIARGGARKPTQTTIDALAVGLDLPVRELRAAADMPQDLGEWTPPDEARFLTPEDRNMLDALVRRLVMGVTPHN